MGAPPRSSRNTQAAGSQGWPWDCTTRCGRGWVTVRPPPPPPGDTGRQHSWWAGGFRGNRASSGSLGPDSLFCLVKGGRSDRSPGRLWALTLQSERRVRSRPHGVWDLALRSLLSLGGLDGVSLCLNSPPWWSLQPESSERLRCLSAPARTRRELFQAPRTPAGACQM